MGGSLDKTLERIHSAVDRVNATPGSGAITAGDIGAAPDGFGLGAAPTLIKDFNEALLPGWYRASMDTVNGPNVDAKYHDIGPVFVTRSGDQTVQMFFGYAPGGIPYIHWLIRGINNRTPGPWEWVNPPMSSGVEYRTVERFGGKPVYAKSVNFGALPAADSKTVSHNIENVKQIIQVTGIGSNGAILNDIELAGANFTANLAVIACKVKSDFSSNSAMVILKYIKKTD